MPASSMRCATRTLALGSIAVILAGTSIAAEPANARRDASCCNVVELRQYTLHPGRREAFIDLFDREFADALDATGMTTIGQFRDLDRPDRFVWFRGFPTMEARAKELAVFYDSDLWHAHRNEANASIDDSDNVLLLEAATALQGRTVAPHRRGWCAGGQRSHCGNAVLHQTRCPRYICHALQPILAPTRRGGRCQDPSGVCHLDAAK
jgi:hypothetical protein